MPRRAAEDYPQVHPKSRAEWRAWLAANHASSRGVWLVSYRKATGHPRVEETARLAARGIRANSWPRKA